MVVEIEVNSTVIHVLSGASNYSSSLVRRKVFFNEADSNYEFKQKNGERSNLYGMRLSKERKPKMLR